MSVQSLDANSEDFVMARHSDLRNTLSLDSLNFFLADVRDGLGPYLAIYLLAVHKWDPASIGVVMTLAGIAALLTQGPAGALIDRTRSKRAVIALAAIVVTGSCLLLPFVSSFSLVALTQAASAVAASVFAPAISAISLGITGPLVGGVASHFGMLYIFPFSMAMVFSGFLLAVLIWQRQKKEMIA